jgi:hypothetical protein
MIEALGVPHTDHTGESGWHRRDAVEIGMREAGLVLFAGTRPPVARV